MRSLPAEMHAGKWSKNFKALLWHASLFLVHDIFGFVYDAAFDDLYVRTLERALRTDQQFTSGETKEWRRDVNWHRTQSTRMEHGKAVANSRDKKLSTLMLVVVLESFSWLLNLFLAGSVVAPDPRKLPAICDLANPHSSYIIACRQMLAALLTDECPRMQLVFRSVGVSTWEEMCKEQRPLAERFIRLVLTADSWIFRRHEQEFFAKGSQWHLARLVDHRIPLDERMATAEDHLPVSRSQVAGRRSQVAGRRSQVAGRRSQVAGGRRSRSMDLARVLENGVGW
jgi:hypothetical protein